jgi:hypothetical protein
MQRVFGIKRILSLIKVYSIVVFVDSIFVRVLVLIIDNLVLIPTLEFHSDGF